MNTYNGIFGTRNCIDCGEPFSRHTGSSFQCPQFSTPRHVRELWASFGTRQEHPSCGCPAATCIHS